MAGSAEVLSNPVVAFALRAALAAYVIYMARGFYADPLSYFRKWMPRLPELAWMRAAIRAGAAFCVWGGCFIGMTAVATQIFDLHGLPIAYVLMLLSAMAAWFLLPDPAKPAAAGLAADETEDDRMSRLK